MKKLLAPISSIAIALALSGCMTASSVNKSATNGLAKIFEAAAKDTNSFRFEFNGFGSIIKFERNGAWAGSASGNSSGVTVTPMATLRVDPK